MAGLRLLEAPHDLPVGHPAVVFHLLPGAGMQVMLDDLVAEGGAQDLATIQLIQRLAQRPGDMARLFAFVDVAFQQRLRKSRP